MFVSICLYATMYLLLGYIVVRVSLWIARYDITDDGLDPIRTYAVLTVLWPLYLVLVFWIGCVIIWMKFCDWIEGL